MKPLYYLATPYRRFPLGLNAAYRCACANAALLLAHHVPVFCPIAHGHSISTVDPISIPPTDNALWEEINSPYFDRCDGLIICKLAGWDTSTGIKIEKEAFLDRGKPVIMMNPGLVPNCFEGAIEAWPGSRLAANPYPVEERWKSLGSLADYQALEQALARPA